MNINSQSVIVRCWTCGPKGLIITAVFNLLEWFNEYCSPFIMWFIFWVVVVFLITTLYIRIAYPKLLGSAARLLLAMLLGLLIFFMVLEIIWRHFLYKYLGIQIEQAMPDGQIAFWLVFLLILFLKTIKPLLSHAGRVLRLLIAYMVSFLAFLAWVISALLLVTIIVGIVTVKILLPGVYDNLERLIPDGC